jgi:hypothetical protein
MNDKATTAQITQASQILDASLFTPQERRNWMLRVTGALRSEARHILYELAAEYRRRAGPDGQEAA